MTTTVIEAGANLHAISGIDSSAQRAHQPSGREVGAMSVIAFVMVLKLELDSRM